MGFAEGWTVKSNENIASRLLESGFNVVNIGKSGNGPLLELAGLKEYAEPLRPTIILWLYFVNDIHDIEKELNSTFLKNYLDNSDFTQNLIKRQYEIDSTLVNYVVRKREMEWDEEKVKKIINFLKLYELRLRVQLVAAQVFYAAPSTAIAEFRNILYNGKQLVSRWNGRMYFVYLPSFHQCSTGEEDPNYESVMRVVTNLDIPIIDIYREVFESHPDRMSLFPFRSRGHYNADGYHLVSKAIAKRLDEDGYIP